MIKYNDNNIYVGYIKQLLKDFNLPRCVVYRDDLVSYLDENTLYIKGNHIFRGDKVIDTYSFNEKVLNITDNYHITSNIYDEETHRYLGDYLRFIRDYTGLDLMSMYNCFTNESPTNLHLDNFDTSDTSYQIFMIPIKFNKVYTIGIDCSSTVFLTTCNYENKDIVNTDIESISKTISGTRFNKPFTFKSPIVTKSSDLLYEKSLKLLIKIPLTCKSSIVVLEGDFTRGCDLYLDTNYQVLASTVKSSANVGHVDESNESEEVVDTYDSPLIKYDVVKDGRVIEKYINYYVSRPQLLYLNTNQCYLLADRLIEYLSRNVIDSNEEIDDNIKLVQKEIHIKDFTDEYNNGSEYQPDFFGMWDNNMRESLYNYVCKSKDTPNKEYIINTYFDVLGYYDKDVEQSLRSYCISKGYDFEDVKTFEE